MPRKYPQDNLIGLNIKQITDPKRRRQKRFGFNKGFQIKDEYGNWRRVFFRRKK